MHVVRTEEFRTRPSAPWQESQHTCPEEPHDDQLIHDRAKAVVAVAVAVAVALTAAAVAQADAKDAVSFEGHVRGASAFFDDVDGESFRICDRYRDDMPVGVRFSYIRKNGTRQTGAHWHTAGVGGLGNRGVRGCSAGSHNFGEGRRVWFQACVGQPEEEHVTCGRVQETSTGPK